MIKDKNIIVIGASGGIGRVVSKIFIDAGARVTLSARTASKLLALQDTLGEARTLAIPADATDHTELVHVFNQTKEKFGGVDAVVIAAGTWQQLSVDSPISVAVDLADHHYQSLFKPAFVTGYLAQTFFRKQGHGLLVNISSHAALRPELSGNLTYGPMKAAAHHFILALAHELQGSNVRVTDIAPAIVNTDEAAALLDTPEKRAQAVQPEDIAEWIIDNFNNPDIPSTKLFDSSLIL
jgi:NAD(P)-dependent dehydrogenase (short-subunit alcohol dehydrogenase family)